MITVTILDVKTFPADADVAATRGALVDIAQDGVSYRLRVGGIPAAANVQQHCEARAAELWTVAQQRGELSDGREPRAQAVAALQQIRDNIDTATAAQQKTAIKRLATILQKILETS